MVNGRSLCLMKSSCPNVRASRRNMYGDLYVSVAVLYFPYLQFKRAMVFEVCASDTQFWLKRKQLFQAIGFFV